ncbi:MAG TPA: hypothetical protein VK171_12075 [Fimbriimonas sp.]|nr:hypothetical protein [Fimbriimonas sp.]
MWILFGIGSGAINLICILFDLYCVSKWETKNGAAKVALLIALMAINSLPVLNLVRETEEKILDLFVVLIFILPLNIIFSCVLGRVALDSRGREK